MEWGGAIADYCFSNGAVVIPLAMRWEFGGAVVSVRRAFTAIIILFFGAPGYRQEVGGESPPR